MKLNFKGKTAVITGASGGMGLEISKKLSQNNISVLMLDIQSPSKEFLNNNKNCEFKKVDVTDFKKLKIYINSFYKKHKRLDLFLEAKNPPLLEQEVYTQVFMKKTGFLPNLSVLDVLFNLGPNCANYLKNAARFI